MVTVPRDDFSAEWHRLAPVIYQDSRYSFFIAADARSVRQDYGVVFAMPPSIYNVVAMKPPVNTTVMDDADLRHADRRLLVDDVPFSAFGSFIGSHSTDNDEEN